MKRSSQSVRTAWMKQRKSSWTTRGRVWQSCRPRSSSCSSKCPFRVQLGTKAPVGWLIYSSKEWSSRISSTAELSSPKQPLRRGRSSSKGWKETRTSSKSTTRSVSSSKLSKSLPKPKTKQSISLWFTTPPLRRGRSFEACWGKDGPTHLWRS